MHYKITQLTDIWRTCNKIRAAIFRVGLNLWDYYLPLDPQKKCLISESQFCSVLSGPLKGVIGLSEQEIGDLADYFRVQDGRILYTQFCSVIADSIPQADKNEPLVTGLEWEDPAQVNRLSQTEERRLSILLTKISVLVNMRKLILRPYFQDYELVSKNSGVVTISHFSRILAYLGIMVSADDSNLLVKKYLKNNYTLNYIEFVNDIERNVQYMEANGMLDLGGDLLPQFPGRLIDAELPKLPRPEIGKILASSIFGKQTIFHPALNKPKESEEIQTVIRRIQRHVLENRLRVNEFFTDYDPLHTGKITVSQFHRGLDLLGISGLQRLFLTLPDIHALIVQYTDPCDSDRVCWKVFGDDIDQVFTTKELEKTPLLELEVPPKEVKEIGKTGGNVWQNVTPQIRNLCEDTLAKVKNRVTKRGILFKPAFTAYDKHNNGHVSRAQMRQCLISNGILLSDEEFYALEQRYNDDLGFNYYWFLTEAESKKHEEPLYDNLVISMQKLNAPKPPKPAERRERDIVMVLAKIKGKIVRERINILQFLRDYDPCNEFIISRDNFKRGLNISNLDLTETEIDTLMNVFACPKRPECIDYKRFVGVTEEAFTQCCLEKAPLIIPIQHIPTKDCERNFLNFDERKVLETAMFKLSKKPQLQTNLMSACKDFDATNCGTISQNQLLKAMSIRGMHNLISRHEFDAVCKCFGFQRGLRDEVDYKAFIKTLDLVHTSQKYLPF